MEARQGAQGAAEGLWRRSGCHRCWAAPRREYPHLATLKPAPDDEDVFGPTWPLIVEWRVPKDSHPNKGKGLSWLVPQVRLMEVEVALLEEFGLTLLP